MEQEPPGAGKKETALARTYYRKEKKKIVVYPVVNTSVTSSEELKSKAKLSYLYVNKTCPGLCRKLCYIFSQLVFTAKNGGLQSWSWHLDYRWSRVKVERLHNTAKALHFKSYICRLDVRDVFKIKWYCF